MRRQRSAEIPRQGSQKIPAPYEELRSGKKVYAHIAAWYLPQVSIACLRRAEERMMDTLAFIGSFLVITTLA
jgi:hypothetical protein